MNQPTTLSDFAGIWHLDRQIDDRRAGQPAGFTGTASLTPDGHGLHYREHGQLQMPNATPVTATRTFLWRANGNGIDVLFDDQRPFHRIDLVQSHPEARHICTPDRYTVTYDFTDWPLWQATWTVTGPRKDYTMRSRYTRS